MTELAGALLRANIAAVLAILLVLALRHPARRWLGAEAAYGLWLLPLIAAVAAVAPARRVAEALPIASASHVDGAVLAWICGAAVIAAWFAGLQVHYGRLARRGRTGPAVVGVVTPRIHMPGDDGAFTAREREVIRAHEREHIVRGDPAWNAVLALGQCLFWFNPFVHLAARLMREDQELACDAAVLRRHSPSRAVYASALLKAQMQAHPMPLGASWLAGAGHPLETRIAALSRRAPRASIWATIVLLSASTGIAVATWFLQPPAAPIPPAGLEPVLRAIWYIGLGVIFGALFLLAVLGASRKQALRIGAGAICAVALLAVAITLAWNDERNLSWMGRPQIVAVAH